MRRMFTGMRIVVVPLLAFGACGEALSDQGAIAIPRYQGVVELAIGATDGDGADVFGRVSGLALDAEGHVYVADALTNEVQVFDSEGAHLYGIGGGGSGPGELQRPCCIAFDQDGLLWVRDGGNGRYNAYVAMADSARYMQQVRMAHGDFNYPPRLTFDRSGQLIDVGHKLDPETGQRRLYRLHLDSSGSVVGEETIDVLSPEELGAVVIEQSTPESRTVAFVYPPFGPEHLIAHGPNGDFAQAISSKYEITWRSMGSDRTITGPTILGPELSEDESVAAAERLATQLRQLGQAEGDGRLQVPVRRPPLQAIFFDQAGRIWVQRHAAAGAGNVADVYTRDGGLVEQVEWPSGIRLSSGVILDQWALGLREDELGTQQVVRLRLVPLEN